MNKVDLVELVAVKAKLTKKDAEAAVDALFDGIEHALIKGEAVKVSGFGGFSVRHRESRLGVNPSSGKHITIPAANAVVFKPSKSLKEKLQ